MHIVDFASESCKVHSGGGFGGGVSGACHGVCEFWKMRFDVLLTDLVRKGWFVVQEKGLNETARLICKFSYCWEDNKKCLERRSIDVCSMRLSCTATGGLTDCF
jgi:hypothetical protein